MPLDRENDASKCPSKNATTLWLLATESKSRSPQHSSTYSFTVSSHKRIPKQMYSPNAEEQDWILDWQILPTRLRATTSKLETKLKNVPEIAEAELEQVESGTSVPAGHPIETSSPIQADQFNTASIQNALTPAAPASPPTNSPGKIREPAASFEIAPPANLPATPTTADGRFSSGSASGYTTSTAAGGPTAIKGTAFQLRLSIMGILSASEGFNFHMLREGLHLAAVLVLTADWVLSPLFPISRRRSDADITAASANAAPTAVPQFCIARFRQMQRIDDDGAASDWETSIVKTLLDDALSQVILVKFRQDKVVADEALDTP
ncbi:hypothetical protein LZ30DRAFT_694009 [Colletotrichum cereale]|nr:hypothetical protein LZ30DRAFT_694009 [Colletotrichum cereale]